MSDRVRDDIQSPPLDAHYFGNGDRRMLGLLHWPDSTGSADTVVVVCYSLLHEYLAVHRAMRQLADRLAGEGYPVFRFDYYGCGDSSGTIEDADLESWLDDVADAVDHAKNRTGASRAILVGIRHGAVLALQAGGTRMDVEQLVMWSPPTDGATIVQEWVENEREAWRLAGLEVETPDKIDEIGGYPVTPRLLRQFEEVDLFEEPIAAPKRILYIDHCGAEDGARFAAYLRDQDVDVDHRVVESSAIWRHEAMEAVVPFQLINEMVSWIREGP